MLHKLVRILVDEYGYDKVFQAIKSHGSSNDDTIRRVNELAETYVAVSNIVIRRVKAATAVLFSNETGHLSESHEWIKANFEDNGKGDPILS